MINFHPYDPLKKSKKAEKNSIKNGYHYPQPSIRPDGTWVDCPRCGAKVFVPLDGWGECACGKSVW